MNEKLLEVLTLVATKIGDSTDLLISELTKYYIITGLIKVVFILTITGFGSRLLSLGIKTINLSEKQDRTDLVFKGLLRLISYGIMVAALAYSYQDLSLIVKAYVAPHVFFLEIVKELVHK